MRFIKIESDKVWIIEPEIHGDKRGYLFEAYRKDSFEEAGLSLEFTREYDLKLVGEFVLGNAGYLISVYEGKADIKADGLKIQIDDVKKRMLYVDAGAETKVCGSGQLCIKTPR